MKKFFADRYTIAILSYFLLAVAIGVFSSSGELRPFFNGHWFYKTPFEMDDFGILVTQINGADVQPPRYLEDLAESRFNAWKFDAYVMTQKVGRLSETDLYDKALQDLRKAVLRKFSANAVLQKRKFNTIQFVENRKIQSTEDIKAIHFDNE